MGKVEGLSLPALKLKIYIIPDGSNTEIQDACHQGTFLVVDSNPKRKVWGSTTPVQSFMLSPQNDNELV